MLLPQNFDYALEKVIFLIQCNFQIVCVLTIFALVHCQGDRCKLTKGFAYTCMALIFPFVSFA